MNNPALILCLLIPLLGAFRVSLIGEIGLGEPLLGLYLLFSFRRSLAVFKTPVAKTIMLLGLLWFAGQISSDFYRGTPFEDYSRGWAKLAVLLISYAGCFVLIGFEFRRIVAFACGMALAPILRHLVFGSEYALYKFVYGVAISLGAFFSLAALGRQPRFWFAVIPFAAGILALFMDARSLAGVTFCAAVYYAVLSGGWLRQDVDPLMKLLFAGLWMATAYSSVGIYSALAGQGRLTEEAMSKYESQLGETGNFNLLSGRGELYYVLPRIAESPLIGSGSWAKDIDYVAQRAMAQGIDPMYMITRSGGLIPSHSHLFGAWLEAGLFGGVFWIYVLILLGRILWSGWLGSVLHWSGLSSFLLILFAWDILFSPFGGERRVNNGFYLWVVTFFTLAIREHKLRNWIKFAPIHAKPRLANMRPRTPPHRVH